MWRKIFCPLDFSSDSQHAMRVAVRLARTSGAELVLAHAWHVPALAVAGEVVPYTTAAINDLVNDEQAALAKAVAEAGRMGAPKVTSSFLGGLPWQEICAALDADPEIDLVVMGTHGRTGFRRILLGSVTEKVVRHAPCSVLAVRGRDGSHEFRHVLCPTDLAATSRPAADLAAALVATDGPGIDLLHILELPAGPPADPATLRHVANLEREAVRVLDEWAAGLRTKTKAPIATHMRIGAPAAQALVELDSDVSFDLVVVGSHGRTGLGRVVLGSVAEQLVRHAPCPVLVARARRAA